jgi:hypothetical protein
MSTNSFYQEIERLLFLLIDDLNEIILIDERDEVVEFIHHAEYGIALETLCFILKENHNKLTDNQVKQIRHLQTLMQIDSLPIDD